MKNRFLLLTLFPITCHSLDFNDESYQLGISTNRISLDAQRAWIYTNGIRSTLQSRLSEDQSVSWLGGIGNINRFTRNPNAWRLVGGINLTYDDKVNTNAELEAEFRLSQRGYKEYVSLTIEAVNTPRKGTDVRTSFVMTKRLPGYIDRYMRFGFQIDGEEKLFLIGINTR